MTSQAKDKVPLTKEYIKKAFSYLEEVDDLDKRNIFFTKYMIEDVTWEITGRGHRLVGTRHSIAEHNAASFARVRERITSAIKFVVRNIILDNESRTACIELFGYSEQLDGRCAPASSTLLITFRRAL